MRLVAPMKLSPAGRDFLIRWEGLRLERYKDSAGLWSIGVGHLIKPGERLMKITAADAMRLLDEDVKDAEAAIGRRVTVPLNRNQFDALVSWVFNLGEQRLRLSTLLIYVNMPNHKLAAEEFPKWCKAKDSASGELRTVQGLLRRRLAERELFLRPVA